MNKKQYITLILLILTIIVFFNHQEYFYCKEPELSYWDEVKIYLNFMKRPDPCPGNEEVTKMALELSGYVAVLVALHLLFRYMFLRIENRLKEWLMKNWMIVWGVIFILMYIWAALLCTGNSILRFLNPWNKEYQQRQV
ncbi:uncharacterized protein LOC133181283 [Saccostrea echinata]|uniref:uncharacterized protein LOC133181283 n=1 Tax=Saccostrea echinata TaxID=191078 RepID=UPI002A817BE1|nr:uncharacterized protein LOC133181283 [Saccostrea echinata]